MLKLSRTKSSKSNLSKKQKNGSINQRKNLLESVLTSKISLLSVTPYLLLEFQAQLNLPFGGTCGALWNLRVIPLNGILLILKLSHLMNYMVA